MSLHPMARARDFAAKLRLTAAALGCTSQKELALAFRRHDPDTAFDLGRSYKWMQGRTLPRSARLFEEWAALLDTGHSTEQLLSCSLEEFGAWIAARHGPVPVLAAASASPAAAAERPEPLARQGAGLLQGHYACYSHAQSPYFQGRVIRASLLVGRAPSRGAPPTARYAQAITGGMAEVSGPVRMYGETPCLELNGPAGSLAPVFMTLFRPTPPASVLAGLMLSFTVVDPNNQPPYATRFVAVRVPEAGLAGLEPSNRYLAPAEWPPSADLAALGLAVDAAPELNACMLDCLGQGNWSGSDRLPAAAFARLTAACDRAWLATEEAAAFRGEARAAAS
ncbi:hypothetical protein [Roseomonas sp. BN140053]|uniref:hypothetical protein n=1 Tax=Roseomonas sp. BN140053 TaxID=3391898 RepID=UPI0039EBD4CF